MYSTFDLLNDTTDTWSRELGVLILVMIDKILKK